MGGGLPGRPGGRGLRYLGALNPAAPQSDAGTDFTIQPSLSWSPDGGALAFISNQSGRFSTYRLPSAEGPTPSGPAASHLVFDQGGPHAEVHGSPDGRWLAVTCEGAGQDYHTYLVPLDAPWTAHPIASMDPSLSWGRSMPGSELVAG
jgi:hypothetical protein